MITTFQDLAEEKRIYLASDFHLGAPTPEESMIRERKIVRWLESIEDNCAGLILVGDLFDFWFEYKHVIPKGFIRFLGKLASFRDQGIPVIFFTGNHDLWMFDYFEQELDITIYRNPQTFRIGKLKIHIGHGDGLGPGDRRFKFYKLIFTSRIAQWAFRWLHPDLGIALARAWSGRSRDKCDEEFKGENEWLIHYCKEVEKEQPHDYYVFGHRHLKLHLPIGDHATYINLGEWINESNYLEICRQEATFHSFEN